MIYYETAEHNHEDRLGLRGLRGEARERTAEICIVELHVCFDLPGKEALTLLSLNRRGN